MSETALFVAWYAGCYQSVSMMNMLTVDGSSQPVQSQSSDVMSSQPVLSQFRGSNMSPQIRAFAFLALGVYRCVCCLCVVWDVMHHSTFCSAAVSFKVLSHLLSCSVHRYYTGESIWENYISNQSAFTVCYLCLVLTRAKFVSTSPIDCLERLFSKMTYTILSGTLSPAHSASAAVCLCQ